MWSSSKPMARNVSHLARLAVAKTSRPQCRANCTAAMPTPPVAGVDQHRLAGLTSASAAQRVERGGEADGEAAACGVATSPDGSPAARRARRWRPWCRCPRGTGPSPGHRRRHAGDTRPDLGDDTGGLDAHDRVAGVQPERDHHVAEVRRDRADRDADAAGLQRRVGVRDRLETRSSKVPACSTITAAATASPPAASDTASAARLGSTRARCSTRQCDQGSAARQPPPAPRRSSGSHAASVSDQHDPAGVLGLRGAHQAPRGRGTGRSVTSSPGSATAPRVDDDERAGIGSASHDCRRASAGGCGVASSPAHRSSARPRLEHRDSSSVRRRRPRQRERRPDHLE